MILNKQNLNTLHVALLTSFATGLADAKPMWNLVATEIPSTSSENQYQWLGQFPKMREWVGDRVLKNITQHSYSITNKTFEETITVPREAVEDDQYGVYAPISQEMGRSAATHPDELTYGLLLNGFTETCYDGQYFFDTDHPVTKADGTVVSVSNFGGGAGKAWFLIDDTRAIKPLIFQRRRAPSFVSKTNLNDDNVIFKNAFVFGVDARHNVGFGLWQLAYASKQELTPANFNAAYDAMLALRGDEDRKLNITPRKLLVGASNRAAANEAIKAERLANGATNTNRDLVEVVVVPWLD